MAARLPLRRQEKQLALGAYGVVTLKEAREKRDAAKKLLASGVDPALHAKLEKVKRQTAAANTFGLVADEFLEKERREKRAEATLAKTTWLLDMARVDLGARPVLEISSAEVLAVLQKVERRGHLETARRLRLVISRGFALAIATGRAINDPTIALRRPLATRKVTHRPAAPRRSRGSWEQRSTPAPRRRLNPGDEGALRLGEAQRNRPRRRSRLRYRGLRLAKPRPRKEPFRRFVVRTRRPGARAGTGASGIEHLRQERRWGPPRLVGASVVALGCAACAGPQSALDPAGPEADVVSQLFWSMVAAGAAIWAAVLALALYAARGRRRQITSRRGGQLVLWCGAILPTFLLAALLVYALWLMPFLRPWSPERPPTRVRVTVVGEQFWWRVRYETEAASPLDSANEVRLPVGEPVDFELSAADVIHSFWIPALGGKMDMIPGRTNRLTLTATRPGRYRAPCAEFCGGSHALMAFDVLAMPRAEFDAWMAASASPSGSAAGAGRDLFLSRGCAACHTIRGTSAAGVVGPDLSRVGGRPTIGAGTLPTSAEAIARFVVDAPGVKPGARMPSFAMLPEHEVAAIADYLAALR